MQDKNCLSIKQKLLNALSKILSFLSILVSICSFFVAKQLALSTMVFITSIKLASIVKLQ